MTRFPHDLRIGDEIVHLSVQALPEDGFRLHLGDELLEVQAGRSGLGFWFETDDGIRHRAFAAPCGEDLHLRVDGRTWLLESAVHEQGTSEEDVDPTRIEAPMTGTVVKLLVEEGQSVEEGQDLVVLSAMKMEHKLAAQAGGRVAEIGCEAGETVDAGQLLVRFEPGDEA